MQSNNDNEGLMALGLCMAVSAACIATRSADPLWLLIFLLWIL